MRGRFSNVLKTSLFLISALVLLAGAQPLFAACGGTARTWLGSSSTSWNNTGNWSGANVPDTAAEDAVIVSATRIPNSNFTATIGCLEIQSGTLNTGTNKTLSIAGDYFRNLTLNSLVVTSATYVIDMAGSGNQTFENVDPVTKLNISNNTQVTFTQPFEIKNALTFSGSTTVLKIQADVTLDATSTLLTIPAGVTVEVSNGATLYALAGVTVNGTLTIKDGSKLAIGNGKTLTVASGAILNLTGSNGNVALMTSDGAGNTYTANIAGFINANYFRVERLVAAGMNVTGTITTLANGEFHYLTANGYAVTLGAAATIPSTMNNLGFFDDNNAGNIKNFNASAYNLTATTLNNWSGSVGGATKENDTNNKINWGAAAGTLMTLSNDTANGSPPTSIGQASADTLFATFAFGLTQAGTVTNITRVLLTMSGTATAADITSVKVYKDTAGGTKCVYDAGTDTLVGTYSLSGSPPSATVNFSAGDVTTNSDTNLGCFHVLAATSAIAANAKTIQFQISATGDVTNSFGYSFSGSSGPPVSAGQSTISGSTLRTWQGDVTNAWNTANNWRASGVPTNALDCKIGVGTNVARVTIAAAACLNGTLQTGGTLDFNNTTNEVAFYGSLDGQSGFTFMSATAGPGVIAMRGAHSQSFAMVTPFPGNVTIANTGGAGDNIVSVNSNSEVQGNLIISQGILRITDGITLTVDGNLTVASPASLEIGIGSTLALGSGKTLTINNGGTLKMVGTGASRSRVTSVSGGYNAVIHGNFNAQYYTFDHIGAAGISVESDATPDATNHLQNGTFSFPVTTSGTMLKLKRQIPTNTMSGSAFSSSGSVATGVTNIDTTGAGAGTLTLNSYSGDLAGPANSIGPVYLLSWTGATNTIDITREASSPASVNAGNTYNMGRFGFKQTQAGASYVDTDLTSLKLTLTGTGTSSDITQARIYYDSACSGSSGTQIGSGTFSGSPATLTFSLSAGQATIQASASAPPKRCIYVEYDVAAGATNAATVGVQITGSGDVANSQAYAASGSLTFPITLNTPSTIVGTSTTTWTGATNTDWFTASNWSAGLPTSTKDCTVNNAARNPVISGALGTARCQNLTSATGTLTMTNATTAILEIYGNYSNAGTLTQNDGSLKFVGTGNQSITTANTITALTFNKTGGGDVTLASSSVTITTLTIPGGSVFNLKILNGKTLVLPNGLSIPAATVIVDQGGILQLGNSKTLTVSGGTFKTTGINDVYPQTTSNKGTVTTSGAGTWSFTATSGTVSLVGFILDKLDTNGVNLSGSTVLSALDGGQLTDLSTSYASVKGFQFNISSIPATATNVGWNWGPLNTPPTPSTAYLLASSSGCGGNTISFDQWFGDFYVDATHPDTTTKVSASSCTITLGASASPVTMTDMSAVAYDSTVDVLWTTGSNWDHLGFNILRKVEGESGFRQINRSLIPRNRSGAGVGASYQFRDSYLLNGKKYKYIIEEVATNGAKTPYGPLEATPNQTLGPAPSEDPSTGTGASVGTGTGDGVGGGFGHSPNGGTTNPLVQDLGGGVLLLAESANQAAVEISIPEEKYQPSPWNPMYQEVSLPGYSPSQAAGHPQLLEKVFLIPVDTNATTVDVARVDLHERPRGKHLLAPVPEWQKSGSFSVLPFWKIDRAAYANPESQPESYYEVLPQIERIGGRAFVKIKIWPIRYAAKSRSVRRMDRCVLALKFTGQVQQEQGDRQGWDASLFSDTLKIRYKATGLYTVRYSQLRDMGLLGPLDRQDVSQFRAYHLGEEIRLETLSTTGRFSDGDEIRFFVTYTSEEDRLYQEVVLSPTSLKPTGQPPLRFAQLDASPNSYAQRAGPLTFARAQTEGNKYFIWDAPLERTDDHFYWVRISSLELYGLKKFVDIPVQLPGLISNKKYSVRLKVNVLGSAYLAQNPTIHLGIWLNGLPYRIAEQSFSQTGPFEINVTIPANYFADGLNQVRLEAMDDKLGAGDYEVVDIDNLTIEYAAVKIASDGQAMIYNSRNAQVESVPGFSTNRISVYDVSDVDNVQRLTGVTVGNDSQTQTTTASFLLPNPSDTFGFKLLAIEDDHVMAPEQMFIGQQFAKSLKDVSNSADLIVIGPSELLSAAADLISYRAGQGLNVLSVDSEQVYAEFSHGEKSSAAVRDFLTYAKKYWKAPSPRYVLLLGKSSYDPKGYISSPKIEGIPIPFEKGVYVNFGDDNWFVTEADPSKPFMSIGRVPALNADQIRQFTRKVIDFESGKRSPVQANQSHYVFYADADMMNEGFASKNTRLGDLLLSRRKDLSVVYRNRSSYADEAAIAQAIKSDFDNAPAVMSFLGHGAIDFWASRKIFSAAQAGKYTNNNLPIVVGLACMTGHFYDADPSIISLAENLILTESGGAIAYWGSPSVTIPDAQVTLGQAFLDQLSQETIQPYHQVRLGDLLLRAKQSVFDSAANLDTIKSWTLFGDPTLVLPVGMFSPRNFSKDQSRADNSTSRRGGCGRITYLTGSGGGSGPFNFLLILIPFILIVSLRRKAWLALRV